MSLSVGAGKACAGGPEEGSIWGLPSWLTILIFATALPTAGQNTLRPSDFHSFTETALS